MQTGLCRADLGRFGTGATGSGIPQPGRWQRPDRRPSESRQIGTHQGNRRRFQGRDAWRHRIRNPARGYLTLLQSGRGSARNFAAAVLWSRSPMAGRLVCVAVGLQFVRHRPVAPGKRDAGLAFVLLQRPPDPVQQRSTDEDCGFGSPVHLACVWRRVRSGHRAVERRALASARRFGRPSWVQPKLCRNSVFRSVTTGPAASRASNPAVMRCDAASWNAI